ncbi:MAG: Snf7 family protein [Nitrososphaerales archaeon]|nr:Snf7 family protein [Nitrososphaerales archaeon]
MSFADKWHRKDEGPGIMGRIKGSVRTPPPIKPQIEQANRQIRVLIAQLEGASGRIRQRDQKIFGHIVASLARHDTQHAAVYANELSEVRRMGKMVTQSQLALEQISLRLSTVTDLGEIATTLGPAVSVIKSMQGGLRSALPQADREMGEISGLLSSILVDAGQTGGLSLNFDAANEDAQKVLEEAAAVAEQRMKESFPEIPADVARQQEEGLST